MNLFATVLTYTAPSANYRGESELNRSVIQKVTEGNLDYAVISPEAMRNALREILKGYGLPMNRSRLHDEEQLAVKFESYPNPTKYADDFLFGYLVAAGKKERAEILKKVKGEQPDFAFKRDSVLRMNLAKSLDPYRHNTIFTQSPLSSKESAYQNATSSALLHRETVVSAFQYPFALNLNDCKAQPEWTAKLLQAIGELNGVAGNHARSYFEMAPASILIRLTEQLVAGYGTYVFETRNGKHTAPEIFAGFHSDDPTQCDFKPEEFYLGGKVVKDLSPEDHARFGKLGVTLERDPRKLIQLVTKKALG